LSLIRLAVKSNHVRRTESEWAAIYISALFLHYCFGAGSQNRY